MGNCLKTQLKSNVQNDNLSVYGSIRIKSFGGTGLSRRNTLHLNAGVTIKTISGGTFDIYRDVDTKIDSDVSEFTTSETKQLVYFKNVGEYLLIDKYQGIAFNYIYRDNSDLRIKAKASDFNYAKIKLFGTTFSKIDDSVMKLKTLDLSELSTVAGSITLPIQAAKYDFKDFVFKGAAIYFLNEADCLNFSMSVFQNIFISSETSINVSGSVFENNYTEDLKDFFDYLVNERGVNSGSISLKNFNIPNFTINGNPITSSTITVTFSESGWNVA